MRVLFLVLMTAAFLPGRACSCFGPDTFCGVLNPPYAQPEWWLPDAVVLAVPVLHEHYGMDVAILQVFQGLVNADTVRVWGDNGALCRLYTSWALGDTIILGLHQCDLAGNSIQNPEYPPDLERPAHYMISACGVYMLDVAGGQVIGPIAAPMLQTMSLEGFAQLIGQCALANGVDQFPVVDPLVVRVQDGALLLEWNGAEPPSEWLLLDASGRTVRQERWTGHATGVGDLPRGLYLIILDGRSGRMTRRVVIG
ncbi:MAG: T9SS type A sorting domain-containing protein [Flavobacteriales bacterium]|nr:T9SS type A sorting domain-containing protein [Flavobacteriales bacterium]HPF89037.1 T9SS type A sorting domain-containing protein [Flavobacteriales bacterium]